MPEDPENVKNELLGLWPTEQQERAETLLELAELAGESWTDTSPRRLIENAVAEDENLNSLTNEETERLQRLVEAMGEPFEGRELPKSPSKAPASAVRVTSDETVDPFAGQRDRQRRHAKRQKREPKRKQPATSSPPKTVKASAPSPPAPQAPPAPVPDPAPQSGDVDALRMQVETLTKRLAEMEAQSAPVSAPPPPPIETPPPAPPPPKRRKGKPITNRNRWEKIALACVEDMNNWASADQDLREQAQKRFEARLKHWSAKLKSSDGSEEELAERVVEFHWALRENRHITDTENFEQEFDVRIPREVAEYWWDNVFER